MGQNMSGTSSSSSKNRRKSFRRRTLRSPFPKRSVSHQSSLSATFIMPDLDTNQKLEQLNVNIASEEELMTLPGITRTIAQNIVEYRRLIGRFRKVEDLALVSGIGAEKLDKMRPEICISKRGTSSRAQSLDSLKSTDSNRAVSLRSSPRLIDINRANVFDLQCLHGMTQELAANIVHFRDKKGPFKSIDGLLKVRGMDPIRLGSVRSYITLNPVCTPTETVTDNGRDITTSSNSVLHTPRHRKSLSVPTKFPLNGFSKAPINDIFELLSAYSYRPIVEEDFKYERNGEKAIRIATWNLDRLCLQKAENLGFREVVCRTILENRFSVIAVQDVHDISALKLICDELNKPTLRRISEWKENSHEWNYCLSNVDSMFVDDKPSVGFIYDLSSGGIRIEFLSMKQITVLNGDNGETKSANNLLAKFHIGDIDVSLLNVYIHSSNECDELKSYFDKKDDVMLVLGDFTECHKQIDELVNASEFLNIVPISTNTSSMSIHPHYNSTIYRFTDNILLGGGAKLQYTGVSGTVRQGLTHMAIPRGWSWGGPASEHCPVWCEVYIRRMTANDLPKKSIIDTNLMKNCVKVSNQRKITKNSKPLQKLDMKLKNGTSTAVTNGNCTLEVI